jgi:hypothetical protein
VRLTRRKTAGLREVHSRSATGRDGGARFRILNLFRGRAAQKELLQHVKLRTPDLSFESRSKTRSRWSHRATHVAHIYLARPVQNH